MSTANPAECVVYLMIRFLKVKNVPPAKMYEEGGMNKWCHFFNGGSTDVNKEARSVHHSVITMDLKGTTDEIHTVFPHVSQSVLCKSISSTPMQTNLYQMATDEEENESYGLVKRTSKISMMKASSSLCNI
jgi:hypothetical protein